VPDTAASDEEDAAALLEEEAAEDAEDDEPEELEPHPASRPATMTPDTTTGKILFLIVSLLL
jgi:hypothetical protein